jgi:uncharacterized protein YkwD
VAIGAVAILIVLVCTAGGMAWAWQAANAAPAPASVQALPAPTQEQTSTGAVASPQPATTATPATTAIPVRRTPTPISSSGSKTANGCAITAQDVAGEQHLLDLLNSHRAAAGVAPLTLSPLISRASREHSCDMFQHQQLSHTGSDGSSPFARIRATSIAYTTAGENIGDSDGYALTKGLDLIDHNMMAEPLTSGNHHWNIVNAAYTQVGLGVIYTNGELWFTEDFAG